MDDVTWQRGSEFWRIAQQARERVRTPREQHAVAMNLRYFQQFAGLAERTRSSIVMTLSSVIDLLLHGTLYELFCTDTTITPDNLEKGAIIVMDMPMHGTEGRTGQIAQYLFKYLTQQALLRCDVSPQTRPVFLLADEAHRLLSSHDYLFLAESREVKVCNIFATQSISNYYAALQGNRESADALLALFNIHVWLQNSDPATNHYASRLIGQAYHVQYGWQADAQGRIGISGNLHPDDIVPPWMFSQMIKGGSPYWLAEAIIFTGQYWQASQSLVLWTLFPQIIDGQRPAFAMQADNDDLDTLEDMPHPFLAFLAMLLPFIEDFFILQQNPALLLRETEDSFISLPEPSRPEITPVVDIPASSFLFSPVEDLEDGLLLPSSDEDDTL
ncbi:MAG: TraM recognition domain-containing protein [Chloroflexota bacterium]